MARQWFHPPVTVQTNSPGLTIAISSVERAAEQLLTWQKRGPLWHVAVATCMNALNGIATADEVRTAFVHAARESDMLLES